MLQCKCEFLNFFSVKLKLDCCLRIFSHLRVEITWNIIFINFLKSWITWWYQVFFLDLYCFFRIRHLWLTKISKTIILILHIHIYVCVVNVSVHICFCKTLKVDLEFLLISCVSILYVITFVKQQGQYVLLIVISAHRSNSNMFY